MSRYSVIIATHHRPEWLKRAVLSVKAQASQTIDIIIVSDVVCELSYSLVHPLLGPGDLFVQHNGIQGPAESRNIGIQLLSSDYAFFLDDDDEIPADFVANMDARRPQNFKGIIYSDFAFKKSGPAGAALENYTTATTAIDDIYVRNFIPNSCLIYPVRVLKGRRFDPSLSLNEDWDFILNAKTAASLAHVQVGGPIIHKTQTPRRGNSNDHLLIESYMSIYRKWPAPTKDLKLKRKTLLAQNGIEMPLGSL